MRLERLWMSAVSCTVNVTHMHSCRKKREMKWADREDLQWSCELVWFRSAVCDWRSGQCVCIFICLCLYAFYHLCLSLREFHLQSFFCFALLPAFKIWCLSLFINDCCFEKNVLTGRGRLNDITQDSHTCAKPQNTRPF